MRNRCVAEAAMPKKGLRGPGGPRPGAHPELSATLPGMPPASALFNRKGKNGVIAF